MEVVYGRAGDDDEIINPAFADLDAGAPSPADGASGATSARPSWARPGPFGYTVRVLPRHPLLANPAELGLVAVPVAPAGMINGDLR